MADEIAIRTTRLTKDYGQGHGLFELDLEVDRGEILGFLGPNGAGKSTTMRLLLDLIKPTSGSATLLGLDSRADSLEIRRRVGFLPGDLALYPRLTGAAMLDYLAELRGGVDRRVRDALAERFDADLDRRIRELSTGNRQKLGLIQAFMHEPELLILDEPIAGLDPLVQQSFHALLREVAGAGPHRLPLVAHPVRGRAGRGPGRDPAARAARRRRLARGPPRGRGAAARDRVRGTVPRAEELRAVPGVRDVDPRRNAPRRRVRGLGRRARQGARRLRGAVDPQPRRRPRGDLPALLPRSRGRVSLPALRMTLRLRMLTTLLSAFGMIARDPDGRRAVPGGRETRSASSTSRRASPTLLGGADYGTITGWMRSEIGAVYGPLLRRLHRHLRRGRSTAGEEEAGILALTLAHPIERSRLVLAKAAAVAISVALVALATFVGLVVGVAVGGGGISLANIARVSLHLAFFGWAVGALALALAASTGRRAVAAGAAAAFAVLGFLRQRLRAARRRDRLAEVPLALLLLRGPRPDRERRRRGRPRRPRRGDARAHGGRRSSASGTAICASSSPLASAKSTARHIERAQVSSHRDSVATIGGDVRPAHGPLRTRCARSCRPALRGAGDR